MKLGLRTRLLIAFAAVLIFTVLVGVAGLYSANLLSQLLTDIYLKAFLPVKLLNAANLDMDSYSIALRDFVIASDLSAKDQTSAEMDKYEQSMKANLDAYRQIGPSDTDTGLLAKVDTAWADYKAVAKTVMAFGYGNSDVMAAQMMSGDGSDKFRAVASALAALTGSNEKAAQQSYQDGTGVILQARSLIGGATVAAILVGLTLAFLLARSLSRAARLMAATANQIAEADLPAFAALTAAMANGDLTQSYAVQTRAVAIRSSDELGDLARAFNAMIDRLQAMGASFDDMARQLQTLISQVAHGAASVIPA